MKTTIRSERIKKDILQFITRSPAPSGRISFYVKANFYEVEDLLEELNGEGKVESYNKGAYKFWRIRQ